MVSAEEYEKHYFYYYYVEPTIFIICVIPLILIECFFRMINCLVTKTVKEKVYETF